MLNQKVSRELRVAAMALQKAGRELLQARGDAKAFADGTWAQRLMASLFSIACHDQSLQSLQALKLAMQVTSRRVAPRRKRGGAESALDGALSYGLSEEELDAEIAEIDNQLALLREAGIPSAQA